MELKKIGIDIDAVLLDYEKGMLANAEIFDLEKCRGKGRIFLEKDYIQNQYDWSEEEKNQFIQENLKTISEEASIMAGAKEVVDRLKELGYYLVIISARGIEGDEMIDIVTKKLEEKEIYFDQYYWKVKDKIRVCKEENIDIMIDDSTTICRKMIENHIFTIYFRGIRGNDIEESKYLKEVSNWGEVYRLLKEEK